MACPGRLRTQTRPEELQWLGGCCRRWCRATAARRFDCWTALQEPYYRARMRPEKLARVATTHRYTGWTIHSLQCWEHDSLIGQKKVLRFSFI